jgi:Ribbon-helix-helix protein, copG family
MSRMRRIQVVIDPGLDDHLEREAAARGMSKSALVRECVERGLRAEPFDNGLVGIVEELAPLFADVEPIEDLDTELYGPLEAP